MPSKHGYRGYGAARTPGSQDRGLQDEKLSAGKIYSAKTGKLMSKGGGADTGTVGEWKSKIGVAINKVKRMRDKDRLTESDIQKAKELVKGDRKYKPLNISKRAMDILKSSK